MHKSPSRQAPKAGCRRRLHMAAPASCLPARRASVEAAPPGGRAALRAVPALPAAAAAETPAGSRQLPRWVAWFPCRGLPHRQSQLGRTLAAVCMCSQRVPQQPASCGTCVRNFQALMFRCPQCQLCQSGLDMDSPCCILSQCRAQARRGVLACRCRRQRQPGPVCGAWRRGSTPPSEP